MQKLLLLIIVDSNYKGNPIGKQKIFIFHELKKTHVLAIICLSIAV